MKKSTKRLFKPVNVMATATILVASVISPASGATKSLRDVSTKSSSSFKVNQFTSTQELSQPTNLFPERTGLTQAGGNQSKFLNAWVNTTADDFSSMKNGDGRFQINDVGWGFYSGDETRAVDAVGQLLFFDTNTGLPSGGTSRNTFGYNITIIPGGSYKVKFTTANRGHSNYPASFKATERVYVNDGSKTVYEKMIPVKKSGSVERMEHEVTFKALSEKVQVINGLLITGAKNSQTSTLTALIGGASLMLEGPTATAGSGEDMISGEALPNVTILAQVGEQVYETTSDSAGKYTLHVPGLEVDESIQVQQKTESINSEITTTKVEQTNPDRPVVEAVSNNSEQVKGTGVPGATVNIITDYKEGNTKYSLVGKVDSEGRFNVDIPKPVAGSLIAVSQTVDGKTSELEILTVTDAIAPEVPSVNLIKDDEQILTGTAEADATVIAKIDDTSYVSKADQKGFFSIDLKQKWQSGTSIEVTVKDAAGNVSNATTVIVESSIRASDLVENLFTDGQMDELKESTKQSEIDEAQEAVEKLHNGTEKDNLKLLVQRAQQLFDISMTMNALFDSQDVLRTDVTQKDLDQIKALITELDSGKGKQKLEEKLKSIQQLLEARIMLEKMLTENGEFISETTQEDVDSITQMIDRLSESPTKKVLETQLEKARKLFEEKQQQEQLRAATELVEQLFTDDQFNDLEDSVKQSDIDAAEEAVEALLDSADKTALEDLIDVAQAFLDAKEEMADVIDESGVLIPGTSQEDIDKLEEMISHLPEGPMKDRLEEQLEDVKAQFEEEGQKDLKIEMLNEIQVGEAVVSGKASQQVERVYIYLNGTLIRYRLVEKDGSFTGHVSNNLRAGDVITVIPQDQSGNRGEAKSVTVTETEKLSAPTLDSYTEGQEKLSGTVAEDTQYVRIYVNGKHLRKRNVESDGHSLLAYVLDGKAQAGDTITVVPYTDKNVAGTAATLTVKSRALEIKEYMQGDEQLFGNATPIADKVDLYVNDKFLRTRDIDKTTGDFYMSTRTQTGLPLAGDVLKIVARKNNGQVLSQNTTIVKALANTEPPVVEQLQEGDTILQGQVTSDVKRIRIYYGVNYSQVLNRGVIDNQGHFSAYVGDLRLMKDEKIKVVGVLANKRETKGVEVTVE